MRYSASDTPTAAAFMHALNTRQYDAVFMSVGKEKGRSPSRVNNGKCSGVVMGGTLHYHSPEVSFVALETLPDYI